MAAARDVDVPSTTGDRPEPNRWAVLALLGVAQLMGSADIDQDDLAPVTGGGASAGSSCAHRADLVHLIAMARTELKQTIAVIQAECAVLLDGVASERRLRLAELRERVPQRERREHRERHRGGEQQRGQLAGRDRGGDRQQLLVVS